MKFTDTEKRKAIEREIRFRQRVYPRWVASGRMKQEQADYQIAVLLEIAEDYRDQE